MTRIYIIRHGQTEKNKVHALQGRSDDLLNDSGIMQAQEAADWFRAQGITFDQVYSSPLKRAIDTGRIAAGADTPLQIDDRLIEMDYGPYEGMDLKNPAPEVITFFSDFVNNPAPEGMEPLADVVTRTGAFLEEIKAQIVGKTVLISTHAIAMKGILEYLTPESKGSYWSKFIGNCAIYETSLEGGKFKIPWEVR
jgi:broad specificity phosphatase PhoE